MQPTLAYFRALALIVAMNFLYLYVYGQEKDVYKVVPFLKGNKWGLVYPDGQEFYPAVFDSIHLQNVYSIYSVFGREKDKERAVVEKGGRLMWLSPDKKLVSVAKIIRTEKRTERVNARKNDVKPPVAGEVLEAVYTKEFLQDAPVVTETPKVFLQAKNGSQLEVRKTKSGYDFYRDSVLYPDLNAESYFKSVCENGRCRFLVLEKNGLQALVDLETLKFLIPFKYDRIYVYGNHDDLKLVMKDSLYGLVDISTGRDLIPVKYQGIAAMYHLRFRPDQESRLIVKRNNKFFFLHYSPSALQESPVTYDILYFSHNNFYTKPETALYVAKLNGKKGLVTHDDSVILPLRYDSISYSNDNRLVIIHADKKAGFYNVQSGFLKEPVYDQVIRSYHWGNTNRGSDLYITQVRRGKKVFFVDSNGHEFISK